MASRQGGKRPERRPATLHRRTQYKYIHIYMHIAKGEKRREHLLLRFRKKMWKESNKGKVMVYHGLSCRKSGWPRMQVAIAKIMGVRQNKLPLTSAATEADRGCPFAFCLAMMEKEDENEEDKEEDQEEEEDEENPDVMKRCKGIPEPIPVIPDTLEEEENPDVMKRRKGIPEPIPVIPDTLEEPSEIVLMVISNRDPKHALQAVKVVQGHLGPALEQGPAMSLLVQVPRDQFQDYQREFQDLQHLLIPGTADPSEQVAVARDRCKEGAHLVMFDDRITRVRVNKEMMKPGELWELVLNGWRYMMACKCGAWSINAARKAANRIHPNPLLPQRCGLHLMSDLLFGQVVKHTEGDRLCVYHGQVMANLERSLRTYTLYPSGGILTFLHVRACSVGGRSFSVCKAFQCMF